jgi:hypothetical protein
MARSVFQTTCRVRCQGSTFVVALLVIATLSLIGAHVLLTLTERYRYHMQTSSWQEALLAAEAGGDMAMSAFINSGWPDGTTFSPPSTSSTNTYTTTLTHSTGEGSNKVAVIVKVDAPASLSDSSGQWYRVRATGISEVPKIMHIGYEPTLLDVNGNKQPHSDMLRKFSFRTDKSGGLLSLPQVSRTIEIIVQPGSRSPFLGPIILNNQLTMSGGGIIAGMDSSSSLYSTNRQYDSAKKLPNSAVTVNIIQTNDKSDLKDTYVYGNIAYNGTAVKNDDNVQGTVTTPSSATTAPVSKPNWTVISPNPTIVNGSATLNAGTKSSPTYYKLSSLTVPGGQVLTLRNPTPGTDAYINIWVTGNFTTSGSGYIKQEANVHVTYYVEGDITVSGSSFNNVNGVAADNVIYGVTPSDGSHPKVTVSGGGNFVAAIDAPAFNFKISGSAVATGASIGNTMDISGGASVIYDAALKNFSGANGTTTYKVASWVEDIR